MNADHLDRVNSRIGNLVLAFCTERIQRGEPEFYISELQQFVSQRETVAPASPDRILRALRAAGKCSYEVVDRRKSRYRIRVPGQQLTLWAG